MITGAVILIWGMILGVAVDRLVSRASRRPQAVCGCGHGIGFHQDKTGRCSHAAYNSYGNRIAQCHCQHYDGPIPVESMFATPLLPPSEG